MNHQIIPTERDIEIARELLDKRLADPKDEGGPEAVMFSWGYGCVWYEGEVTALGAVIFTVDPRGAMAT